MTDHDHSVPPAAVPRPGGSVPACGTFPPARRETAQAAAGRVRAELAGRVRDLAGFGPPGEPVDRAIARVARHLGLSRWQVRKLWYGETKAPAAHIADIVRAAHERAADTLARMAADRARLAALLDGDAGDAAGVAVTP